MCTSENETDRSDDRDRGERAAVNLVDVFLTFFVLVGLVVLAPIYYTFIDMVAAEADPFSTLLLRLVVPLFFIGLIISVGVSARRGRGG